MSMVDPCILELLEHSDSRYTLVVEASKRGRQIVGGMPALKTAVEEINRGLIAFERANEEEAVKSDEL